MGVFEERTGGGREAVGGKNEGHLRYRFCYAECFLSDYTPYTKSIVAYHGKVVYNENISRPYEKSWYFHDACHNTFPQNTKYL